MWLTTSSQTKIPELNGHKRILIGQPRESHFFPYKVTKTLWQHWSFTKWLRLLFRHSVMSSSATPRTAAHQSSLSFIVSQTVRKLMPIKSAMPSNRLILCCPLLLLPSIFPSIRVCSSQSALCIRWSKYWSFSLSFSICPSNEYSGLGLSRVFSKTTLQKHQFFGAQPSLWSNSHLLTWLLEKP